jgi:hypothetical protein
MTFAIQELVLRDVAPVDSAEITDLVVAALWDGQVSQCGDDAGPAVRLPDGPPWTMGRAPMP